MLWNDERFVAIFEARLSADDRRSARRAADALQTMRSHAASGRVLSPPEIALFALRWITASLGEHADSAIAAFERARATCGRPAAKRDLRGLETRASAELRRRKAHVRDSVVHMLPFGLTRTLARTLVDQALDHGLRRLAKFARDGSLRERKTVFIGHSAIDRRIAGLLKDTLSAFLTGDVDIFVSSDLDSIKAGEDWLARIIDRLRHCSVVVAIITPNSTESPWVHYEVGVADAGDPLVIPVTARGGRLSELPAPLGRRQGRNLASAEEAIVLLSEIGAALGVTDRDTTLPCFDELVREARRPILGAGLSATALRIAEILSERSENAAEWDPSVEAEALMRELGVSPVTFLAAISELQELGWLLSRDGGNALGLSAIGPAEEFFIDSEAALGATDPGADARRIAGIVARRPGEASRVNAIAAELGWSPRRMNAALHVLRQTAPASVVSLDSRGPLAYVLVLPDPAVLRLAQRP